MQKLKTNNDYLNGIIGYYLNQFKQGDNRIDMTVRDWLNAVATNREWAAYCKPLRALATLDNQTDEQKKEYQNLKNFAPCVTPCGVFSDKGKVSTLQKFTGLIAMDLDQLREGIEDAIERLKQDPYVYVIFKSISGRGLCVLFKIDDPKTSERFKENFAGIREYLISNYGLTSKQADASVSNMNRIRYISSDPDIFMNPDSSVARLFVTKAEAKRYTPPTNIVHSDKDIDYVVSQIEEKRLEFHDGGAGVSSNAGDWYRAGLALASKYGEAGFEYFDRISQFRHDYDQVETEKKYYYLCRNAKGTIGIATFYHIAKQLGCNIMCDSTKVMVSVSAMHKKQKAPQEETIRAIVTMLKLPEVEVKGIVSQVYAISEPIDTEEDVFDQLRTFLSRRYPMQRNIITRNLEDESGRPYSEEALNTVYFECKKHVDKAISFQDFYRMINSDTITEYDPFLIFFAKHKHINTTGHIDKLIASIIVAGGQPAYVRVWVIKWLLGLVSSMLGKHSPICLVMAGAMNKGKTEFFRQLLPFELNQPLPYNSYFGEAGSEKDKDEEILMTKKIILFDDEFGGKSKHDQKRFKNLSSKQTFSIREPYGRQHKDLRRLAVLCGSCNEMDILNDPTGNRRIVPVLVESIDWDIYNSIDKLELLMEVYHLHMSGATHHVTQSDIDMLNQNTEDFETVCLERELLNSAFRKPKKSNEKGSEFFDLTMILRQLEPLTRKHIDLKRLRQEVTRAGYEQARTAKTRGWYMCLTNNDIQPSSDTRF